MKRCTRCLMQLGKEAFRKRNKKCNGKVYEYLNSTCRKCDAELHRLYHEEKKHDPEYKKKNTERVKKYRIENIEIVKVNQKVRRDSEKNKSRRKQYDKENKERIKELSIKRNRKYVRKNIREINDAYILSLLSHPREKCTTPRQELKKQKSVINKKKISILKKRINKTLNNINEK